MICEVHPSSPRFQCRCRARAPELECRSYLRLALETELSTVLRGWRRGSVPCGRETQSAASRTRYYSPYLAPVSWPAAWLVDGESSHEAARYGFAAFITYPSAVPQYTLVWSTTTSSGSTCPDAIVVTVAPAFATLATEPSSLSSLVQ